MGFLDKKAAVPSNPYTIEQSIVDWKDGVLCVTKVKHTSREIEKEGYKLSIDDLNKLRQLWAKINKLTTSKLGMLDAVRNLIAVLEKMKNDPEYSDIKEIGTDLALGINQYMDTNYGISKTCINKVYLLVNEGRIK
jgi:hypothetical protein|tara:strand:+ start:761 stop:1168 length:408 start_codon:yes stop_codon:yes gene_type:complete